MPIAVPAGRLVRMNAKVRCDAKYILGAEEATQVYPIRRLLMGGGDPRVAPIFIRDHQITNYLIPNDPIA
jgi:hypothetical protein